MNAGPEIFSAQLALVDSGSHRWDQEASKSAKGMVCKAAGCGYVGRFINLRNSDKTYEEFRGSLCE